MEAGGRAVKLRTARLQLRPFRPDDLDAFGAFAGDPAYRRYLGPEHPQPEQFIANNVSIDWKREHSWVIVIGGEIAGSIFLGLDKADLTAEIACLLAPAAWGRGIAGEAGRAVVDYAFGALGAGKVFARADAANAASRRAMEKAGMVLEGVLRSHRVSAAGERVDEAIYGITREDWQSARPHGGGDGAGD
jgi:RimJ/RimL family protein N-acetyltransferase